MNDAHVLTMLGGGLLLTIPTWARTSDQTCKCRITGHTYLTYGPLLCGASNVVFEGVPSYPDAGRCWQVVDKYKVHHPCTRQPAHAPVAGRQWAA